MIRYYCSGFDLNNAFGYGLGDMFKKDLKKTESIVYICDGSGKIEKTKTKYIPFFTKHFQKVGIEFENTYLISPDVSQEQAKEMIKNADFVMLTGGDPFTQKQMCEKLDVIDALKKFDGTMLGYSAGAMFMSKYIIVTPCSEEYPDFRIEEGLNLDGLSVYPHNNTSQKEYPDELVCEDEAYRKSDLITVAKKYGKFYLLQDFLRQDGLTDISFIKVSDGHLSFLTEQRGKIWAVEKDIRLVAEGKCDGAYTK